MDLDASTALRATPERVFAEVADLATYPGWLGIVQAAQPAPAHDDDPGPAWTVDLGMSLGPLTRTKRVRMVRTAHQHPERARFERVEHDGRTHSSWVLSARVEPEGEGARVTLGVHYGGAARIPGIDMLLREEVRRAGERLQRRLSAAT